MSILRLYRWHIEAAGEDPRKRRCDIINAAVARILRDEAVRRTGRSYYVGKYAGPVEGEEVRLTVLALREHSGGLVEAVERHLKAFTIARRVTGVPDRICDTDCTWYRRRLEDITDIALDLHLSPMFDRHRTFLVSVPEDAWDQHRGVLAPYLAQHSATYRARCGNGLAADEFWREFLTRGPDPPTLSPPGHWLWNILLG